MNWNEIREHFPHQWLIIEAIDAHSENGYRILDRISVVQAYPNSENSDDAMDCYKELHLKHPERELLVAHTAREELVIKERVWLGIRPAGKAS